MMMSVIKIKRDTIRDKVLSCMDRYLEISDKHRLSVGIYYRGNVYMLEQNYEDEDFRYDIGSISKTMTAHLVLKLVEEGLLELDKTVDYYLPIKKGSYPTIYELLTHTAGYVPFTPIEITFPNLLKWNHLRKNVYEKCTSKTVLRSLQRRRQSLIHRYLKRKSVFGYSDFAYAVLAVVVEEVLKRPFGEVFEEFLQKDLGLKNTVLSMDVAEREPKAVFLKKCVDFWKWNKTNPYAASGGLVTTMEDMLRYMRLQAESDLPYVTKAHEVCTEAFTESSIIGMCIGWRTYKNSNCLWHVGGVGTFRSSIMINRRRKIGVCVLGNAKGTSSANVHFLTNMFYNELKRNKIINLEKK